MLNQVVGKKEIELPEDDFLGLVSGYVGCVVDLGTGDGKFVATYARQNPDCLVVGIDADVTQMQELSRKLAGKPEKGGQKNAIFFRAAAEQLPHELSCVADRLYILFPWGSLLAGIVSLDPVVMQNIVSLVKPGGEVQIYLTYDTRYEPEMISKRGLPELSLDFLRHEWASKALAYGLNLQEVQVLNDSAKQELVTSWRKRILSQRDREVYCLRCGI